MMRYTASLDLLKISFFSLRSPIFGESIGNVFFAHRITMENGPFIEDKNDDLPIQNGDFPVRYLK